ncbi:hypothetical protein Vqi01_09970 [Micromonospora qiuiae]|uniref:Uncharacterized protein n=1 Tax=Micromonospora qiuiae TaxID=502268 RepID=A0ABQ4J774_9ACTN|nr:hypothetical protein [Micromonospora qiuiae]GIJ25835.1 hypothetical protein Vqi01_09970 [Micromonospora qiuiae]
MTTTTPAPLDALTRHFTDLRDGDHFGQVTRTGKESAFTEAAQLLDAPARRVLAEFNAHLLADTGRIDATGLHRDQRGGLIASWLLTWPEQRAAGLAPISLIATYGAGFHHPHLCGATVGEWPLNVAEPAHAEELVPVLRTIAAGDIHNLVFQVGGDWRIIPALHPATERRSA